MKWYKFGFSRIWDNLSIEIRNGRLSRKNAIKKIKKIGNEKPKHEIIKFCEYVDISQSEFNKICEKIRNKKIWIKEKNKWKIDNFFKRLAVVMRLKIKKKPRKFTVGINKKIKISDLGKINLKPDEQISFITESLSAHDVTRKNWGFYATQSINSE